MMIEALYEIGKILPKVDFLEEFIENVGSKYKQVFKIIIDITNLDDIRYCGIGYEELDSSKKMKYFYKTGSSRGVDKTPTSKITDIHKTLNIKVKPVFSKFLEKNKRDLSDEDKDFLNKMQKMIDDNIEDIKNELIEFARNRDLLKSNNQLKEPSIVTFIFKKDDKDYYVGDMEVFRKPFQNNENSAYSSFYKKYNIESKSNDKYCYVCRRIADEVWGFVNTYNFYTVDKESYVAGGFNQGLAWRNYPVCPDCAKILERAKTYADKNLVFKFCGFNYYIIPQLVLSDDKLSKKILTKLEKYKSFSLEEGKASLIERVEEAIIRDLAKENNNVNFNFIFFEKSKKAFKILLFLQEIAPSRLKFLIEAKDKVDKKERKYEIFKELKTEKDTITFDFSFNFIRNFFSNNKTDGKFDKYFLSILNNIFINKKIYIQFLLERFMDKISIEFLNDNWIDPLVLQSYKILLYLEQIKILERRRGNMKNYGNDFEDFFQEHPLLDDETKRALFLEGVLAKKLLNIQYQERKAKPFKSRLNGLKIDEKVAKRLLPEMVNKLEEYEKNYYVELEKAIGEYLLKSDFSNYSVDELSYYFTLGLILADYFKVENENKN